MEANLAAIKVTEERIAQLSKIPAVPNAAVLPPMNEPGPKGWQPDLQGAFDWFEGDSGDGPITAILRNREGQFAVRDAELALVYLKLWARLSEKEQQKLKAEQTEWLATRTKNAAAAGEKGYPDETLAALRSLGVSTKMTEQRLAEFRKRRAALVPSKKRKS
jgi:uncharacterized protein YecT (DUF1311 family)